MSSTTSASTTSGLKASWQISRKRLFVMLLIITLMFGSIIARLTELQVISSDRYSTLGESQRIRTIPLAANRGTIFDRFGRDLAISVPQQTIWIDPAEIKDDTKAIQVASMLAPVVNKDQSTLLADIRSYQQNKKRFMYISRRVDDDVAARVKALELPGVHMYDESERFITGDDYLSPILGNVDHENKGQSGLEFQYQEKLGGKPGSMLVEQDINGNDIPGGARSVNPSERGDDLVLTIDSDLQHKVDSALKAEIELSNAKGGMAAIMDTKTGEVLALSNLVVANEGKGKPVKAAASNLALTNVYEPGSVSKLITMGAALEEGIIQPTTSYTVADEMRVADAVFHDSEEHATHTWTATDIFAASSNTGTIQIAQKLGKDKLDEYQRAFGYGTKTGLGTPGESPGIIQDPKSKHYSGTALATSAIGQGVSVTTMQMLAAFNTVANNGVYVAPKLVKSTIDSKGKEHPTEPSATRRVLSEETAAQMNLMMQEVVRAGTATTAQIDGYEIGGKTGTARKPRSDGKSGYQDGAYISSFGGFLPAANPKFTAIVILDEPTPIYGGVVAGPVFADITRYALQKYGIAPEPWGSNRHGVPLASQSATSTSGHVDSTPGLTADQARAATAAANAGSSSTSTTAVRPSNSGSTTTTRQLNTTTGKE